MIEEEHTPALGRRIAVLRKWREKHGKKATYERLAKVFCDMGNAALADDVAKVLLQSEPDSSEGEPGAFSQKTGSLALIYSIHFLSCVATLYLIEPNILYEYSSFDVCIFKVARFPVFLRSTNLESKLIQFFVFVEF